VAKRPHAILITCEHGGNRVPPAYRFLFQHAHAVLAGHRGFDAGALQLARQMARRLNAHLVHATTTRLLIDLNRSARHRQLFSEFSRKLPALARANIIERFHTSYRSRTERWIAERTARGVFVYHLSCHSFTPVFAGRRRQADIGLLYDPKRASEVRWAKRWQCALHTAAPGLAVRRNYPYRGVSDGLTSHLRTQFGPTSYAGIELEVNQRFAYGPPTRWRAARALLCDTIAELLCT